MAEKRNRWGAEPDAPAVKRNRWGAEPDAAPAPPAAAAAMAAMESLKKKKNLAEQVNNLRAPKLIIDSLGRELDENGKVIPMRAPNVATLKINQRSRTDAAAASGATGGSKLASTHLLASLGPPAAVKGSGKKGIPGGAQSMVSTQHASAAAGVASMISGIASHMRVTGGTASMISNAQVPGTQSMMSVQSYATTTSVQPAVSAVSSVVNKQGLEVLHSGRHFDPSVKLSRAGGRDKRRMMGFSFVQDDKYVKQQEEKQKEEAKKAAAKALEEKNRKGAEAEGVQQSGAELIAISTKANRPEPAPIPVVREWWDTLIVLKPDPNSVSYGGSSSSSSLGGYEDAHNDADRIDAKKITHFVEHPVPIRPATMNMQLSIVEKPLESMLTPQERKKLRRRNRQERAQQMRDKIKMGLLEPPPPKVKFSNLMRVLGDEQIANPTEIEARVKKQTEQRRLEHEKRNAAAKLAPEERKLKKQQRWDGNTVGGPAPKTDGTSRVNETHVLVFSLKDVSNKKHLYKININAEQFQLTGCMILCPGLANLLCVEGGKRAITRYRKLVTRRIKWNENAGEESDDEEADANPAEEPATLMWQGTIEKRLFDSFKVHNVKTEAEGRQLLSSRNCESYWTMLESFRDSKQDL
ncbi:unnamed protein product [Amoebophrya sp. A25]|nr:unnamed protein product [Amoebophrya sp. A25]|eukprot:GSA25T00014061001.1